MAHLVEDRTSNPKVVGSKPGFIDYVLSGKKRATPISAGEDVSYLHTTW